MYTRRRHNNNQTDKTNHVKKKELLYNLTTNQPAYQYINQCINQPIYQSIHQPTRLINQPTNQPTNQSTNRSTDQPTNQPINQRTNQPAIQSTNRQTIPPNNSPTNRSTNQPTNLPTYQSINTPTNHPNQATKPSPCSVRRGTRNDRLRVLSDQSLRLFQPRNTGYGRASDTQRDKRKEKKSGIKQIGVQGSTHTKTSGAKSSKSVNRHDSTRLVRRPWFWRLLGFRVGSYLQYLVEKKKSWSPTINRNRTISSQE